MEQFIRKILADRSEIGASNKELEVHRRTVAASEEAAK